MSFRTITEEEAKPHELNCYCEKKDTSWVACENEGKISHVFGKNCFITWANQSKNPTCPLCRKSIKYLDGSRVVPFELSRAALNGDLEEIQAEIDLTILSEELRGRAVRDAAKNGHLDVVQTLLANNATISEQDRGWAVQGAAQNGHSKVVRELTSNRFNITKFLSDHSTPVLVALTAIGIGLGLVALRTIVDPKNWTG